MTRLACPLDVTATIVYMHFKQSQLQAMTILTRPLYVTSTVVYMLFRQSHLQLSNDKTGLLSFCICHNCLHALEAVPAQSNDDTGTTSPCHFHSWFHHSHSQLQAVTKLACPPTDIATVDQTTASPSSPPLVQRQNHSL